MSPSNRAELITEALTSGRISGLPDRHFIDGAFVPSCSRAQMETFDPGTGRAFAPFARGNGDDIDRAVTAARTAMTGPWRNVSPAERGCILHQTSVLIRKNLDRLAVIETLDCGKPLRDSLGDVGGAARAFEYYAGACDKIQGESFDLGPDHHGYSIHEPVGVTGHIIPWNFPLSTAARGIAPALAAGCCVIAKPAEQTPLSALILAELLHYAGLPKGVCNVVSGTGTEAGAALVAHPDLDHITFTGSFETGVAVMKSAADHVTRLVLELGGKSPLTVLADCNMDAALDGVIGAIFENAGQVCSAGSRLLIERAIHGPFIEKLVQRTKALTIGHGLKDFDLGPVNSQAQLQKISRYLDDAHARGLEIMTGGQVVDDPTVGTGWFVEPTIVNNLTPDDRLCTEEIFGPVLAVQVVDGLEDAIAVANQCQFGLAAGIYSANFSKVQRYAHAVDAGQIYINEYFAGGIEVPFGGNKKSGYGREKGLEALKSYSKIKSVAANITI